ncbi:GMNN family protein [Megaselia abdita]
MSNKVFIKIESNAEQQENLKNTRKTLKVLQNANGALDKENALAGRATPRGIKGKIDEHFRPVEIKRKKNESRSTQTDDVEDESSKPKDKKRITAEDLTSEDSPGEAYWESLAEKRREALESSLVENKKLHERIEGLEEELDSSRKMIEETKNLVEILQEIISEQEVDAEPEQE